MGPRGIPGLFIGCHLHSGGRWSGDCRVTPLTDWDAAKTGGKAKVGVFRVKDIYFDQKEPNSFKFPLREALDNYLHTIHKPKKGSLQTDIEEGSPDVDSGGESATVRDPQLPVDVLVSEVSDIPLPEEYYKEEFQILLREPNRRQYL